MKTIQILGTGCAKCSELADNAQQAADQTGEEVTIEKVTELKDIMQFGCMTTPGLAIDGKLVSQGKLLKPDQVAKLLRAEN